MADRPIGKARGKPRRHDVEQEMLYVDRIDDSNVRCTYQNCWKRFTQVRNCRQHIRSFHLRFLPPKDPDSNGDGNCSAADS